MKRRVMVVSAGVEVAWGQEHARSVLWLRNDLIDFFRSALVSATDGESPRDVRDLQYLLCHAPYFTPEIFNKFSKKPDKI